MYITRGPKIFTYHLVQVHQKKNQIQQSSHSNWRLSGRDERILIFLLSDPILFLKKVSVSNPIPVLIEIMPCVSENYPKVHFDAQHIVLCLFCHMMQNNFWSYIKITFWTFSRSYFASCGKISWTRFGVSAEALQLNTIGWSSHTTSLEMDVLLRCTWHL